ncbi:MAG: hypothetical protein JO256_04770 [Alphaproteobacteria bacterium]|nr:hypothetical protein [Alphaproteobacteria bacterium]
MRDPVIIFWLMIGVIAVASLYFRHATAVKRTEVLQAMIEKGAPIPPDLFQEPRRRPVGSRSFVAAGILLLGTAAAMLVFFLAFISSRFGVPDRAGIAYLPFTSAFPFFVGIACLLVGRYFKSHE